MSPASTEQFLLEQYTGHPASQLQDLRKALYQSVFGCEHLITDTSAAAEGIRREAAEAGPCSREIEALDGPWSRVQLGVLADGLTPETLSRMFARSAAMSHGDADALQEKLTVLRRLIRSGALPYSPAEADAELDDWRKNGFPVCRHSEEYRAAYRTALMSACCRFWRPLTGPWRKTLGSCWPLRAAPPAAKALWQIC